jgi:hypothetical protein
MGSALKIENMRFQKKTIGTISLLFFPEIQTDQDTESFIELV